MSLERAQWSLLKTMIGVTLAHPPIESDLPVTKRGENYIPVYKIIGSEKTLFRLKQAINIT